MARIVLNESPVSQGKTALRVSKSVGVGTATGRLRRVISGDISVAESLRHPEKINPYASKVMSLIKKGKTPKYHSIYGDGVYEYLAIRTEKIEEKADFTAKMTDPNKIPTTITKTVNEFLDLSALITVTSKNNILMTKVQGRDASRKEYISGGDFMINITGTIINKEDSYPEEQVRMLIEMLKPSDSNNKVLNVESPQLNRFGINGMIVLSYKFPQKDGFSNVQEYQITAVSEQAVKVLDAERKNKMDKLQSVLKKANDWIALTGLVDGTQI